MLLSIPLAALLAVAAPLQDQGGGGKAAAVAPLVGDDVAGIVRLDLTRRDLPEIAQRFLDKADRAGETRGAVNLFSAWVEALRKAGARELFLLLDLADLPGLPVAVVPLAAGSDGPSIAQALLKRGPNAPIHWPATETLHGAVVAGTPTALARIREARPAERPELAPALSAGGDAPLQILLLPSSTQRRAIEESMTTLPPQLGGGPITTVSRGLSWASLALVPEPRPTVRIVAQARDAGAAGALAKVAREALAALAKESRAQPEKAGLAEAVDQLRPEAHGDRVTLEVDLEKIGELLALPIRNSREGAWRSQCTNNMKQIGLAMHNYHASHNTFPPAYSTSKDGKPLLSWRVHILPFLEQQALYDEFHLNEPWDSPHNKALISRMPAVYKCPSGSRALAGQGKTSYLVPHGPGTIFPDARGIKIQEIRDGTSNTILVVDAGDDAAVPWTKPADWEVVPELKPQSLFGHHPGGTNFGLADGSVRFIGQTIEPKLLEAMTTRNGREEIPLLPDPRP